uniref:LRRCT domain-containing protein n=1 Tax=Xiphophorus couchianus TaxID=32473 RepID=A0A3B5LWT4_9TELE
MKIFLSPLMSFLLLLILPDGLLSSNCPDDCLCAIPGSILCSRRRSSTIPGELDSSTKNLFLFANGIEGITAEDFNGLLNLEMLDLSQNKLTGLPERVFEPLSSLKNLDLSSNQITHISEKCFHGMPQLERLYLYKNKLESFPSALRETPGLFHLNLEFSQLFPHLEKLAIAENPFNCLCNLAWFPRWLRMQSITLERTEETRCHFPPISAGKVLERLETRDFGCPTTTAMTTTTIKTTTTTLPGPVTTLPTTTRPIQVPRVFSMCYFFPYYLGKFFITYCFFFFYCVNLFV